ncbi:MAG: hypothetical protein QOC59_607 [Microbacteriaceae bacterium]|jgi:hypothetical protein|nr:hypothetical protein [Microbacteriaceae bacterium]
MNWVLVLVQLPSEPSRHRVAVWRELRKGGAVPVGAGTWAMPSSPVFQPALDRASTLCRRGGGTLAVLDTEPRDAASEGVLRDAFTAARLDEWAEFTSECGKFDAELKDEAGKVRFTLGALEDQEQSLDRLRRWYRDLRKRDVLQLPEAKAAQRRLHDCEALLNDYADRVYESARSSSAWTDRRSPRAGAQDVVA